MKRLNVQTHSELASVSIGARPVTYTRHAKERAREKQVLLAASVHVSAGQVVEMEVSFNRVSKLVVRQPLRAGLDRVLVLVPNGNGWTCVTVWTNRTEDTHRTLSRARISA